MSKSCWWEAARACDAPDKGTGKDVCGDVERLEVVEVRFVNG